jgi:Domain of unknown function (DUF1990)
VLLVRRAVAGEYWIENQGRDATAGPHVTMGHEPDLQRPEDAPGPLNQRSYRVRIADATVDAVGLIDRFRRDPNQFSPTSYATFVPDPAPAGLEEGDTLEVKLPGPWNGPVRVRRITPTSVRLETLQGHMEAGLIEFAARSLHGGVEFSIHSLARSGDRPFDALYTRLRVAKQVQSQMWAQVLEAAVRESGGRQQGRLQLDTVIFTGRRP